MSFISSFSTMESSSWYQRSELQQWNRRVNGQWFVTFIYLSTPWLLDDTASAFQPTTTSTRKATFTKWVNDTYDMFILFKLSFPKHYWSPKRNGSCSQNIAENISVASVRTIMSNFTSMNLIISFSAKRNGRLFPGKKRMPDYENIDPNLQIPKSQVQGLLNRSKPVLSRYQVLLSAYTQHY